MSQCRRGYHQKTEFFSVHYFAPSRTIAYRSFHIIMSGCVCVARSLDCLLACTLESTCARFCATISVDIFYLDTILYRALTQFPKVFFLLLQTIPMCPYDYTYTRIYECRWLRLLFHFVPFDVCYYHYSDSFCIYLFCCCLFVSYEKESSKICVHIALASSF